MDKPTTETTSESNIKILVCIGSSPSSATCIRWAAKTAESFHAPWVAVNIEHSNSLYLKDEEKRILQSNMELSEQLGGEVVTLNGNDIATTIADYAKRTGITNIVIGKSRNRKNLKNQFELDLEDKLISLLSDVEIQIIPNGNIKKSYHMPKKRFFYNKMSVSWHQTGITLAALVAAGTISLGLKAFHLGNEDIILIYVIVVLIISRMTSSYFYGILASALSVLTFNYFFIEPYFTRSNSLKSDIITFVFLSLVSIITSSLTVRTTEQTDYVTGKEQRTELLYEISKKLLVTTDQLGIINLANEYITKIFKRSSIFYIKDPNDGFTGIIRQATEDLDSDFFLQKSESNVAHWVFLNQKPAGFGTDVSMDANAFYIPLLFQGKVLGVIGLSCANKILPDQNSQFLLRMIASQVAMALDRQRLSDKQRVILLESEKEKMRSNLLRAISHDLRTPLTGIIGASSTILENIDVLDDSTKKGLIANIKDESQWLIRMVENLLTVTRIDDSSDVVKTPEAAEEIIASAISRIKKRYQEQKINVKVPDELLIVPMDGTLIEQVIINLIENSIKHSGNDTIIDVELKKEQNMAVFEVSDNGQGISDEDFPYLFENYVPNGTKTSDSSRGMGIGLPICMTIIKAHHGKMEAENKKDSGAVFRVTLPLDKSNS